MENMDIFNTSSVEIKQEVETTEVNETKPNTKAQIPFLADLIKLEQQCKLKSEKNLIIQDCSSHVYKLEILSENMTIMKKTEQSALCNDKIEIRNELADCHWGWSTNSDVNEFKEISSNLHSPLPIRHDAFSDSGLENFRIVAADDVKWLKDLPELFPDIEIIEEETEDFEFSCEPSTEIVVSSKIDCLSSLSEQVVNETSVCMKVRKYHVVDNLSKISMNDGKLDLSKQVCNHLSENGICVPNKSTKCGMRSEVSESFQECDVFEQICTYNCKFHDQKRTSDNNEEKTHKSNVSDNEVIDSLVQQSDSRTHIGEKQNVNGEEFSHSGELKIHKRQHAEDKPYKCVVCCKKFANSVKLNDHKRTHSRELLCTCDMCGRWFVRFECLRRHLFMHIGEKMYVCDICGKGSNYRSNMSAHRKMHAEENQYKCDDCGKRFNKRYDLRLHQILHSGETPYKCGDCGKGFTSAAELQRHKRRHTGEKPYICDVCGQSYNDSGNLTRHRRKHTGEQPYQCDICGKRFTYWSNIKMHKIVHTGEKPYQCDICSKSFPFKYYLIKHKRTHSEERPYKCDGCGKGYKYAFHVQRHKRAHAEEQSYTCDVCGSRFTLYCIMKVHKKSHTAQERQTYKQDICGKTFTEDFLFRQHKRIQVGEIELNNHCKLMHSKEKRYKCDNCGKAFISAADLQRHNRTHTGERPYQCDMCGNRFTTKGALKSHILTHTGERPYICDVCGKGFSRSGDLLVHKRIHTGEKPYQCDMCGKRFIAKNVLRKHKCTQKINLFDVKYVKNDLLPKSFLKKHTHESVYMKQYKCDLCGERFTTKNNIKKHVKIHI